MSKTKAALITILLTAACAAGYGIPHIQAVVESGAIKTWSTGENATPSDLNANFSHIHSQMVGGHGGRLLDADVAATAAISTSKLAAYRYVPVAWASVQAVCGGTPCTLVASQGITSITRTGAGDYTVNLSTTRSNAAYAAMVTSNLGGVAGGDDKLCFMNIGAAITTTTFKVECYDISGAAPADAAFNILVFDND